MHRSLWQILRTGMLGAAMLAAGAAAAGEVRLVPHTAEYHIKISVLGGTLSTRLDALAEGYRAESTIQATGMSRLIAHGLINESSVFEVEDGELRPTRYLAIDSLSSDGQTVDLEFDWADDKVSGTIDGEPFSDALNGLVHDRVSLQYGLMHDLLNGIDRTQYKLQDAEELKPLNIRNIGKARVEVPFGKFEATGIEHQATNSSRVTTLWCAEELGYLPVIIEQHRNGKLRVRAVLTDYRPNPSATLSAGAN